MSGCSQQRYPLPQHFIDDHNSRIFLADAAGGSVDAQMAGASSNSVATSSAGRPAPSTKVQHHRDQETSQATDRAGSPGEIAATKPGRDTPPPAGSLQGAFVRLQFIGLFLSLRIGSGPGITYFSGGPVAEIDGTAAIAAERHIGIVGRDFFFADRTTQLSDARVVIDWRRGAERKYWKWSSRSCGAGRVKPLRTHPPIRRPDRSHALR